MTKRADPPEALANSSTIASLMGKTVLDPSMSMVPAPQAARTRANANSAGARVSLPIHFGNFLQPNLMLAHKPSLVLSAHLALLNTRIFPYAVTQIPTEPTAAGNKAVSSCAASG